MKDVDTVGEKTAKNGHTTAIYHFLSFPNSLEVLNWIKLNKLDYF